MTPTPVTFTNECPACGQDVPEGIEHHDPVADRLRAERTGRSICDWCDEAITIGAGRNDLANSIGWHHDGTGSLWCADYTTVAIPSCYARPGVWMVEPLRNLAPGDRFFIDHMAEDGPRVPDVCPPACGWYCRSVTVDAMAAQVTFARTDGPAAAYYSVVLPRESRCLILERS